MKKWMLCVVLLVSLCSVLYAQDTPTTDPTIAAIIAASEPTIIDSFTLANYAANVIAYPCTDVEGEEMAYERLDITNAATNETRTVADQLRNCQGLGAFGLSLGRFVPLPDSDGNEGFLFFNDAREGEPDGAVLGWVPSLWRVNLADFQVELIGQAKFSLTGEELVTWDQNQIRVMPAAGDDFTDFPLMPAGLQMVEVTWLPFNSGVIYIQTDKLIGGTRNTVTHIDLATMEQTILLDQSDQ